MTRAKSQNKVSIPLDATLEGASPERVERLAHMLEERLSHVQRIESIVHLSAGIAHDFNNLLSVIMGNCDILLDRGLSESDYDQAAHNIEKAAQSGRRLTRKLLSFARQDELTFETVDAAKVVGGLSEFVDRVIGNHITVKVDCCDDPWPIVTDYNQFESALLNLALNARDAMSQQGSIVVSVRNKSNVATHETHGNATISGDFVVVRVADTGPGIPSDVLPKIFEPFFTTKSKERGSGLGLSMVYGFVKQSSAFICVDSNADGTAFEMYFPRQHPAQDTVASTDATAQNERAPEQVLLVEDNPEVAWVVKRHLTSLGFDAVLAPSAEQAVELYHQHRDTIRLVFCDYNLGSDQTGLDLIHQFSGQRGDVQFILSSGEVFGDELPGLADAKHIRLLQKPYRREDLAALLDEMLRR